MSVILNLIMIGLVLLIAYWWSNQGFFSALLHLIAVIVAGALALAFWEPFAIDVLLGGGTFDGYAMGLSLAGLFAFFLAVLRWTGDSIVRSNIMIPQGPDMAMGAVAGLCSGILTIGFTMTALGFIHGPHEFMGYKGFGRERGRPGVMSAMGPGLWIPVDKWTNEFYDWASISTLYPNLSSAPLKHYNPDLYMQASLLRDNTNDGEGQISMPADGVVFPSSSESPVLHPEGSRYWVLKTRFNASAMDFGKQLSLASSQVRLVGKASQHGNPEILHPIYWTQDPHEGDAVMRMGYAFDDRMNYATSVPGRKDAEFWFIFESRDETFDPNFLQVRGTRFDVPAWSSMPGSNQNIQAMLQQGTGGSVDNRRLGGDIGSDDLGLVLVIDRVPNFSPSRNRVPGTMDMLDGYFESGFLRMQRADRGTTSRALQAEGIYSEPGTQIVYVDVSRNQPTWLGGQLEDKTDPSDELALIDSYGNKYTPIGYVFYFGQEVEISLDPRSGLTNPAQLPVLSKTQEQRLLLVFQVTGGVKVTSFRLGHTLIGSMDVDIPAR
ncbi:MAG: hypothetical protein CMJ36_01960 [Phycisphaerae bacterium]|nr:hypothetical protein [Phycisphaerae bacterium]